MMEIEGRTREEAHPGRCFFAWRNLDSERRGILMYESGTSFTNMAHDAGLIHDGFHGLPNNADISAWVAELNEQLLVMLPGGGFTRIFVAIVDPVHMEMSYMSAGFTSLFLYRAEDGTVEQLPANYPALALLELDPAPTSQISLAPGDVLLCTNDGLVTVRNVVGEVFGEEGVLKFLREKRVADTRAFDLLLRLFEHLDAFGSPTGPDPVALAVRISG